MRIDVDEQYMITLREVYNPVVIRDESAGGVAVCERDGKIEVTWLKAGENTKEQIANSSASPVQQAKPKIISDAVELLSKALGELSSYENAPSDVIGYVEDAWSLLKGK